MGTVGTIEISAPAKLNLSLSVLGRRPDGYHEIESWVARTSLRDELRIMPGDRLELRVSGRWRGGLGGEDNLVLRAARALGEASGRGSGAVIELEKRIPPGAGLGGGSSDAAAALIGLNKLWGLELGMDALSRVGEGVGSDVPLFLREGQSVIRGRGERVEEVTGGWHGHSVVVWPGFGVATVAVYRRFAERGEILSNREQPWADGGGMSSRELSERLFNDLEAAAMEVEPRLREARDRLKGIEDRVVMMTGSGSALFSLFDGEEEATAWADRARGLVESAGLVEVVRVL